MRQTRLCLTIFVIFVSSLAEAKVCEAPRSMGSPRVDISDEWVPLVEKVFSTITSNEGVLSLLPNKTYSIQTITLNLDKRRLDIINEFDRETGRLMISAADCEAPWSSELRSTYLGPFIHEYGHAIFEANARAVYKDKVNAYVENALRRQYTLMVLKNEDAEALRLPMPMSCMLLPFNELFADTMAVVMTGDPSTIAKFVAACLPKTKSYDRREFSATYPLEGWDIGSVSCRLMSDAHPVMNPSRTHIWQTLKKNLKDDPDARAKVLHATLEASFQTIDRLSAEGPLTNGKWTSLPLETLNRIFIRNFDQILAQP